jgi:hypothetical protein
VNASNQIVGDKYDAAGNLWVIPDTGGATCLYSAENQMKSTSNSSMSHVCGGDGQITAVLAAEQVALGGRFILRS